MRYLDLRRMLIKTIDLPAFAETEAGVKLSWSPDRTRCKCRCPMPGHSDRDPSFSFVQHGDGWGYKCFGCGSKGTVIEFYMDYYGVSDTTEAIRVICEKFDFRDEAKLLSQVIAVAAQSRPNKAEQVAEMHLAASVACRLLLRKSWRDPRVVSWVRQQHGEMNRSVRACDYASVEITYDRACELLDRPAVQVQKERVTA